MAHIYVTRHISDAGIQVLRKAGHTVDVNEKSGVLTQEELLLALSQKPYDAVISLLTDTITKDVFDAVPTAKIFANYAVGYNNINLMDARDAGVTITNTPGVLNDTVAEFTIALMLTLARRVGEADAYVRAEKFEGWEPELFLGLDLKGKMLGIVGAGRIGYEVACRAYHGLRMQIAYYDVAQSSPLEETCKAVRMESIEMLLENADVISLHVPLLPTTEHLINAERLALMKPSALLINTSRGAVIDENALVTALRAGTIRGAGLDVFEHEPQLASGLAMLPNIVLTPHIASASEETRARMSVIAAQNVIDFLAGEEPENIVRG